MKTKTTPPLPLSSGEHAACRLCASSDTHRVYRLKFADLWRCRKCDVAFLFPLPTAEHLVRFYNDPDYHGKSHPNYWAESKPGYSENGVTAREYKKLLNELPVPPGGKLLDVGSAMGMFLDMARKRGWAVKGVELSAHASQASRDMFGLDIFTGDIAEAAFPDNSYDVVTAWDVFEHLADPAAFLKEVRRILKPGGELFIETIQYTSLINLMGHLLHVASFGKIEWPLYRLYGLHHIYYFSRRSMRHVLESGGFEVTRITMTEYHVERIDDTTPLVRAVLRVLHFFQKLTGWTTVISVRARKAGA